MQLMEALIFLIRTVVGLYIIVLLLRMLFQMARADFYNPLSQAIVKLSSPLVVPLRRVLPPIRSLDTATLLLAALFQLGLIVVVLMLRGIDVAIAQVAILVPFALVHRILDIYTVALFFLVIISWVAPHSHNPVSLLATQLTNPLLRPIRDVIPPVGGLDFSVMVLLIFLYMLDNFIIPFPAI